MGYTYDDRSRLLTVTDNLDQTISYEYDDYGNVVRTETISSDGSLALLVESVYDDRNRLFETRVLYPAELPGLFFQVNGLRALYFKLGFRCKIWV